MTLLETPTVVHLRSLGLFGTLARHSCSSVLRVGTFEYDKPILFYREKGKGSSPIVIDVSRPPPPFVDSVSRLVSQFLVLILRATFDSTCSLTIAT